ncbi:hypothetical protein BDZ89DRAFT_1007757 [Hymenopellis radicata]|nr:hypothetical protein BDZ89DRAFT_1007757 [Hymenopellis radicata]
METVQQKQALQRGLHIPLIANEYKHALKPEDWSEETAADQNRLHLVAILSFLSLFNIGNLPVFGLTTSGSKGIFSCGWVERYEVPLVFSTCLLHLQAMFVADKDIIPVDITKPVDALNVATVFAYIVLVHAPRVRLLFADVESVEKLDDSVKSYLLHPDKEAPLSLARAQAKKKKWFKVPKAEERRGNTMK